VPFKSFPPRDFGPAPIAVSRNRRICRNFAGGSSSSNVFFGNSNYRERFREADIEDFITFLDT